VFGALRNPAARNRLTCPKVFRPALPDFPVGVERMKSDEDRRVVELDGARLAVNLA
jgi:hypothetical protein